MCEEQENNPTEAGDPAQRTDGKVNGVLGGGPFSASQLAKTGTVKPPLPLAPFSGQELGGGCSSEDLASSRGHFSPQSVSCCYYLVDR